MKKIIAFSSLVTLFLLAGLPVAQAQNTVLGVRGGYEVDKLEDFSLGADLRIRNDAIPFMVNPTFDYYFTEGDRQLYQAGLNGLLEFGIDNQAFTPYAGAGLTLSRTSRDDDADVDPDDEVFGDLDDGESETALGAQIVGGATFRYGSLQPFVQAQFGLGGGPELTGITAGLLFDLSR